VNETRPQATGFFREERRDRLRTRAAAVLAVVAGVITIGAAVLAFDFFTYPGYYRYFAISPGEDPPGWTEVLEGRRWVMPTLWVTLFFVTPYVLLGSIMGKDGSEGGKEIARDLGATQLPSQGLSLEDRQLLDAVEDMALASGNIMPAVFVLEKEEGVNALGAGLRPADASRVVSRGAIKCLSREEMQGMVAHCFSRMFKGDIQRCIRVNMVLSSQIGLFMVGGVFLLLSVAVGGLGLLELLDGSCNFLKFAVCLGAPLLAAAVCGLLSVSTLQTVVVRYDVYLADASAVQFTRDPDAIASALKKAENSRTTTKSEGVSEGIASMLFFVAIGESSAYHPSLRDRLRRIGAPPG